jgi:hypothetical protein
LSTLMAHQDDWWRAPQVRGELDAILSLLNEARAQMGRDEERVARKLCDALNRAWNARARLTAGDRPEADWPLIKALICGLPVDTGLALLRSNEPRARGDGAADPEPPRTAPARPPRLGR